MHVKPDAEAEKTRAMGAEPYICDQGAAPLWLQRPADKSVKPYSRIASISEAFRIVNSNVLEAEQPSSCRRSERIWTDLRTADHR